MPRRRPSAATVIRQRLDALRLRVHDLEVEREGCDAQVQSAQQQVEQLRRELFLAEVATPEKVARLTRLSIDRMLLCGIRHRAMKRLQRHELEAFARGVLDPAGPTTWETFKRFRDVVTHRRLSHGAAYRLKRSILDTAMSVVERRPVMRTSAYMERSPLR